MSELQSNQTKKTLRQRNVTLQPISVAIKFWGIVQSIKSVNCGLLMVFKFSTVDPQQLFPFAWSPLFLALLNLYPLFIYFRQLHQLLPILALIRSFWRSSFIFQLHFSLSLVLWLIFFLYPSPFSWSISSILSALLRHSSTFPSFLLFHMLSNAICSLAIAAPIFVHIPSAILSRFPWL